MVTLKPFFGKTVMVLLLQQAARLESKGEIFHTKEIHVGLLVGDLYVHVSGIVSVIF